MPNTITFTDKEFDELRQAIAAHVDIANDTVMDDLDIWPHDGEIVLDREKAANLRKEMNDALSRLFVVHNLARKLGFTINEHGYVKGDL